MSHDGPNDAGFPRKRYPHSEAKAETKYLQKQIRKQQVLVRARAKLDKLKEALSDLERTTGHSYRG